ncbi:Oligoribonuclease, mitochondrial [Dirofilaria immitis]|nr:Oligoribonuclease, mitochondrial [Dirofilaria immitis]
MESGQSPSPVYEQESEADLSLRVLSHSMEEPEPCSFNLRLIEAVRSSRCLYDAKDRLYRSADHKIKVWNRLVQILQFDGIVMRVPYIIVGNSCVTSMGRKRKIEIWCGTYWMAIFQTFDLLDPHMIDRQQQQFARAKDGKGVMLSPGGTPHQIVINDPTFSLSLIQEVQQHPCLYDIRDPKYRHSECRNQAWAEIIKNLDFPGDINSIYKQWKKVRDRYVREKRKIRMSSANGGEVEESQWDLFPQMVWIDPFLDDRATHYSRSVKRKHDSEELSEDGFLDDLTDNSHGQHNVSQNQSPYSTMLLPGGMTNVKAVQSTHREIEQATVARSLSLQQRDMNAIDGDKAFALSVTADMLALPEHARTIAKAQIQNWLDNSRTALIGIFRHLFTKSIIAMSESSRARRIVWVDCEMTGLDVSSKTIVEIACVVTEADLTIVEKGLDLIISQPKGILEQMDDWCKATFASNGLLQEIQSSKITMLQAENEILAYVRRHTDPGICPLGGNSVGSDRVFLKNICPHLKSIYTIELSMYRLAKRWYPDLYVRKTRKENKHRALGDIYESIQELNWYKKNIFIPQT